MRCCGSGRGSSARCVARKNASILNAPAPPELRAATQYDRVGRAQHKDLAGLLHDDGAQINARHRVQRPLGETEPMHAHHRPRVRYRVRRHPLFEPQLQHIGTAAEHRLQQDESDGLVALRGRQACQGTAEPHSDQDDLACARHPHDGVDRLVYASPPGRPALVIRHVARVARARIAESERGIAGFREPIGKEARRPIAGAAVPPDARANHRGNAAGCLALDTMEPAEASVPGHGVHEQSGIAH
jgi:hypothetical protein